MSIPASWSFASNSTCFMPLAFRACVTLAPILFLSPNASFRGFIALTPMHHKYMQKGGCYIWYYQI